MLGWIVWKCWGRVVFYEVVGFGGDVSDDEFLGCCEWREVSVVVF